MRLLGAKKKLTSIIGVKKEGQEVEDLVEKYNYTTCIRFTSNYLIILSSVLTYLLFHFPTAFFA